MIKKTVLSLNVEGGRVAHRSEKCFTVFRWYRIKTKSDRIGFIGEIQVTMNTLSDEKRDREVEERFLRVHLKKRPRTTLRYTVEHFEPAKRLSHMKGIPQLYFSGE